ncbi:MAG: aspartate kinase [Candidatus Marinimicrobia bacterium]|nr:aspartate kinase [Candidatus Neomarinimicrobiota bacterium]
MIVMKFGGDGFQNPESINEVTSIIKSARDEQLVVVVSAFGKSTRLLENLFEFLSLGNPEEANRLFNEKFIPMLFSLMEGTLDSVYLSECREVINEMIEQLNKYIFTERSDWNSADRDFILSHGELLTSRFFYYVLRQEEIKSGLVDAREMITTDEKQRFASPDYKKSFEMIRKRVEECHNSGSLLLTQGFIGSTPSGLTTTLGYEGSDLTATFLGSCLNADGIEFYKTVPGIMTADPNILSECRVLKEIPYDYAEKLAFLGPKILHQNAIKPAKEMDIPIRLKNLHAPEAAGTQILNCDLNDERDEFSVVGHPDGELLFLPVHARPEYNGSSQIETILADWDITNIPIRSDDSALQWFLTEKIVAKAASASLKEAGAVFIDEEVSMIGIISSGFSEKNYIRLIKETIDEHDLNLVASSATSEFAIMVFEREHFKKIYSWLHTKLLEKSMVRSL